MFHINWTKAKSFDFFTTIIDPEIFEKHNISKIPLGDFKKPHIWGCELKVVITPNFSFLPLKLRFVQATEYLT